MKNVFAILLQLVLFLAVFGAFSLFPPFHLQHVFSSTPAGARIFIADGLVLAFALYLILLLIEITRKHARAASATSVAFVLAVVFGLLMKFGFLTRSTF